MLDKVMPLIESNGSPCFEKCGAKPYNRNSSCYLDCVPDSIIGMCLRLHACVFASLCMCACVLNPSWRLNAWCASKSGLAKVCKLWFNICLLPTDKHTRAR